MELVIPPWLRLILYSFQQDLEPIFWYNYLKATKQDFTKFKFRWVWEEWHLDLLNPKNVLLNTLYSGGYDNISKSDEGWGGCVEWEFRFWIRTVRELRTKQPNIRKKIWICAKLEFKTEFGKFFFIFSWTEHLFLSSDIKLKNDLLTCRCSANIIHFPDDFDNWIQ